MKKVLAGIVSAGLLCTSVQAESTGTVGAKKGMQKLDAVVQVAKPLSQADRALATFQSKKSTDYKIGEVIVKFKSTYTPKSLGSLQTKMGLQVKRSMQNSGLHVLTFSSKFSMENIIKELNASPQVAYAEPNYILKASTVTDPMFKQMWGLKNTGQVLRGVRGKAGIDIGAEAAWNITKGKTSVTVAVIDTGVDINHPDLKGKIWRNPGEIAKDGIDNDKNGYVDDVNGWDFYNGDNTVFDAMDGDDHGTHTSGTIAASSNTVGVLGVAPNVRVMPLKFLGPWGGDTAGAIEAIEYAKKMGVKITSNSWGGGMFSQALYDAIKNSNSLFVAAAGNEGMDNDAGGEEFFGPAYPASYDLPNILSVAAIDHTGNLAVFSNYGKTTVDIAAPGTDILSTVPSVMPGDAIAYAYYSGTSMATPHVSGAAALLLSHNPYASPVTLKTAIMKTAKPLSSLKGMVASGGMLNAGQALTYEVDSDIPGIPLSRASVSGTLDAKLDRDDVYAVDLLKGEKISVTLSGAAGTDFDLYLYNSTTQALTENSNIAAFSENTGTSAESLTYTAPKDGTYYLDASAYKGSGAYKLIVKPATGAGIYENTGAELGYNGTWKNLQHASASGGSYATANGAGAKVQFVFSGTSVALTGMRDASQGIVKVTVDGISKNVSLYSSTQKFKQQFFKMDGLKAGRHVVTVEWTGKTAAGAKRSATSINLDTIIVQ